ncbi:MAG: hypothetical protein COW16_11840 [Sphingomonadales bacterium CG12_big_fil_rev_8_21_14_0_65_65_10]|nr:MAG: hypothetical protein COW16_11840 [Sphingomonadales bacterium CG12_big_fil_rev_8_21_14_0_65_65_10]
MPLAARLSAAIALCALAGCNAPQEAETEEPEAEATPVGPEATGAQGDADSAAIEGWIRENYAEMGRLMYRSAMVDLDGDGGAEALVYVGGPMLCGTGGCSLVVLAEGEEGFRKVSETSVVQMPFGVLDSSTDGWRDLWVTTYGGGAPEVTRKLVWTGEGYTANASSGEEATAGEVLVDAAALTPID